MRVRRSFPRGSSKRSESPAIRARLESVIEESGFRVALQHDVPLEHTLADLACDERRTTLWRHQREDRVLRIRRLVGEVDPRMQVLQQPAHEDDDDEVRRLEFPVRTFYAPGLDRLQPKRALCVAQHAPETLEFGLEKL